jgi:transcriptional regulator with XRE-family HTH domain
MLKISLKAARINAGLSQKEASKLLKVSNKTLQSWESGKTLPGAKYIDAICKLYHVSYDDIDFLPTNSLKGN